jgi:CRISPR-associated protein Cas1
MGEITQIEQYIESIGHSTDVEMLMGIEGNIRQTYYDAFDVILNDFAMNGRSKQPPKNEVNALVSFGNMMCYTVCLGQIYHTQLNPTLSFLHEPGYRRYSLALDLAEIFKPLWWTELSSKYSIKKRFKPRILTYRSIA